MKGLPRPKGKGRYGKEGKGSLWRGGKGKVATWWFPKDTEGWTMKQIQQQMDKLQMKAQEYDDAKRKAEEENKDGIALRLCTGLA